MAKGTLTYHDLVVRYGKNMAFDLLLTIERTAKINDDTTHIDEETRLLKAFEALNKK